MFEYLKWLWKGRKFKQYTGYHCGCCGSWTNEKFLVPEYKINWSDTWGLCSKCKINKEN